MARLISTFCALLCGTTLTLRAAPPPDDTPSPADAARQAAKKRAISSDLAATLAAKMPKYNPPKPVEKKSEEDEPDLRDLDKPKNGIVRLPKVVVQGQRPSLFSERDLHTSQSLANLALNRYRGLSIVPFASLNAKTAVQMYQEDERLKNMADLSAAAADAAKAGDTVGSEYIRRETNETFMRRSDFGVPSKK